jgi:hypothetical protein
LPLRTDRAILLLALVSLMMSLFLGSGCGGGGDDDTGSDDTISAGEVSSNQASGPVISGLNAAVITESVVVVTWETDEPATSQVKYGMTSSHGLITTLDSRLSESHSVLLQGLASNTTYHYCARSENAEGEMSLSVDQTFTTFASGTVTQPVSEGATSAVPTYNKGDRWVYETLLDGTTYTLTVKVEGEKTINGKPCYEITKSYSPPLAPSMDMQGDMGMEMEVEMGDTTEHIDKSTLLLTKSQAPMSMMSGLFSFTMETDYSHEFVGESLYPLTEGKIVTVTETMTMGEGMDFGGMSDFFDGEEPPEDAGDFRQGDGSMTYKYVVGSSTELVTVSAGTFECLRVDKYDDDGNPVSTSWISEAVGFHEVKTTSAATERGGHVRLRLSVSGTQVVFLGWNSASQGSTLCHSSAGHF